MLITNSPCRRALSNRDAEQPPLRRSGESVAAWSLCDLVSTHLRWPLRAVRSLVLGCLLFGGLLLAGCHIMDGDVPEAAPRSLLSPVSAGIEAVQLDIVFVERDATDPLLTKLVWDEIDQVGSVDLQTRSRLRQQGFRVGLVGMSPPRSLQRLLGFSTELPDAAGTSRHQELAGRSIVLRSGGETEIQTSPIYPQLSVTLPGANEPTKLSNARFVLRAQLERLQDGWVKLHMTPEIHHGTSQLRPVAGPANWQLRGMQDVHSFHELKFTVSLNVGEMVVLSADQASESLLADQFFVNRDVQRPQRRMVVVRLSDMKKIEPLYSE